MKPDIDAKLFAAAEHARNRAYAPYSNYSVGAAILADDGNIYSGCNVENAAYPIGNCAEASAIAAMISGGARRIERVYVTGRGVIPVTPCGGCRQRLREFAAPDTVIVCHGVEGEPLVTSLGELLPHSFGPDHLTEKMGFELSALLHIRSLLPDSHIDAIIVLGSGLSGFASTLSDAATIPYHELEGFPGQSGRGHGVSGHGSDLVVGTLAGKRVAVLTGREHYYENGNAAAMRPALETLAALGAKTLILTNAAGSLDESIRPGDLMVLCDHINYAGMNPLIGEPSDRRFVNMVNCYDPALRQLSAGIAGRLGISLTEGVYLWYSGPSFETMAEIQMAIRLGANAVGMSTVPETIIARMLGLNVWACSAITNMGAGLSNETISHEHTKAMAVEGAAKLTKIIPALVEAL
ncbi:MAG: purine-nucleoside phosphorylase [Hyphomicrobiaceae bacterium]|nr:purine-nucleoside phosphorylase [Hyphomicrobiaceae bacterium]